MAELGTQDNRRDNLALRTTVATTWHSGQPSQQPGTQDNRRDNLTTLYELTIVAYCLVTIHAHEATPF